MPVHTLSAHKMKVPVGEGLSSLDLLMLETKSSLRVGMVSLNGPEDALSPSCRRSCVRRAGIGSCLPPLMTRNFSLVLFPMPCLLHPSNGWRLPISSPQENGEKGFAFTSD